jgi:hypothetical protein
MILKNTYNSHHTENNGGPNEKEHPSSDFQARLMAPWFFMYARNPRRCALLIILFSRRRCFWE